MCTLFIVRVIIFLILLRQLLIVDILGLRFDVILIVERSVGQWLSGCSRRGRGRFVR
jgi:hypothetical protein